MKVYVNVNKDGVPTGKRVIVEAKIVMQTKDRLVVQLPDGAIVKRKLTRDVVTA